MSGELRTDTTKVGHLGAEQRIRRHQREIRKLREQAVALLVADRRLHYGGSDHSAKDVALRLGFNHHDLVVLRIQIDLTSVTAIVAPTRFWHGEGEMARLVRLTRLLRVAGRRCLLVPASYLRRRPRLDNAKLIMAAAGTKVSATQMMSVEMFLANDPNATLADCAAVVGGHPDPFAAVLRLVFDGRITVDIDHLLGPHSRVSLVSEGAPVAPTRVTIQAPTPTPGPTNASS